MINTEMDKNLAEAQELTQILARFVQEYGQKPPEQPDSEWLKAQFLKEIAGLTESAADAMSREAAETVRAYDQNLPSDELFTIRGDEFLCRNTKKKNFFILNVHTGEVERYNEFGDSIDFNSEYIVIYRYYVRKDQVNGIKIIYRHSPNQCKILEVTHEGLCWDHKMLISGEIRYLSKKIKLSGHKVFFAVGRGIDDWLAYFDISSEKFNQVYEIRLALPNSYGYEREVLCASNSFAYLYTYDGYIFYHEEILKVDLCSSLSKELTFCRKESFDDGIQFKYSDEYLVWLDPDIDEIKEELNRGKTPVEIANAFSPIKKVDRKKVSLALNIPLESLEEKVKTTVRYNFNEPNSSAPKKHLQVSNLFAVELSTGKIKTVPIYLVPAKQGTVSCVCFRLHRSMLYCCQSEDLDKKPGERIGYKFNLAAESLEATEFKF